MEKLIHTIPFLRITVALMAGIISGSFMPLNVQWIFGSLILCIAGLVWINSRYRYAYSVYFGIGIHIFFFGAGIFLWKSYNQQPEFHTGKYYEAVVLEVPAEKTNSFQTVLELTAVAHGDSITRTREKLIAWIAKNDKVKEIKPGHTILFSRTPQVVKNNNNPFEFDYKSYLAAKRIYRQVYMAEGSWRILNKPSIFTIQVMAERVRKTMLDVYSRQDLGEKQYDVIAALTLGYKRELDAEIKNTFAAAGTMHVLAVSGLHTGILFLMLNFLFGFLRKNRYGSIVFVILVICSLWGFAFITGLSPSVKRAATMFTFVVVGQNLQRQVNIYNTLAASAFFLLATNPNLLFDAGFQLSYTAVFGIVFLQPELEKLIVTRYRIIKYIWQLFTVSVAAQLATFPISAYYFHQFPVYFWISNLFVIPVVILLIPAAFLLLALHWIPFFASFLSMAISSILKLQFLFLEGIENLPGAIMPVSFSLLEFLIVVAALITFYLLIGTARLTYLRLMLTFMVLYLSAAQTIHIYQLFQKEIIVYNFSGQQVVHFIVGKRNYIVSEEIIDNTPLVKPIVNNVVAGLRLEDPVLLTSTQTYMDSLICLKEGMVYFSGQVVGLGPSDRIQGNLLIPDISIFNHAVFEEETQCSRTVSQFQKDSVNGQTYKRFNLKEKGAYVKKW